MTVRIVAHVTSSPRLNEAGTTLVTCTCGWFILRREPRAAIRAAQNHRVQT